MSRWKPVRAGIRNVWEYDDQIFHFADGRLILRGPNGSGKSNALALLFPFLLDATMSAARMDPFAGGRSMKALLLSAERDGDVTRRYRYDQRIGYVWMEFGDGLQYRTIGAGVRATAQRDADAWYFVTEARPGIDLDLTPLGVPFTRAKLADVLKPGSVFDTADAYREAVDREFFEIGGDRYRNLLELVLRLRRPQLAGKLQLDELSKVLSDGLPALDPTMIADVAASFDDLEAVQRDLQQLEDAARVVDAFVAPYSQYLRVEAASRAERLLDAERSLRRAERAHTAEQRRVSELGDQLTEFGARLDANEWARTGTDAQRRAHLESPAYRDAAMLNDLVERAQDARSETERALVRRGRAEAEHQAAKDAADAAALALGDAQHDAERARAEAIAAADCAGVAWTAAPDAALTQLEAALRQAARERRVDIDEVLELVRAAETAATRSASAREAASASAEAVERAREGVDHAETDAAGVLGDLCAALAAWQRDRVSIIGESLVADLVGVASDPDGEPGELPLVLARHTGPIAEQLVRDISARQHDRDRHLEARDDLEAQHAALVAIDDPGPEPVATRPASRSQRVGAPFYACVDFVPGVGEREAAGIEAALEAAGLLDAWISPGGAVPDAVSDAFLRSEAGTRGAGATINDLLRVTVPAGCELRDADVAAVLGAIGRGSGECWVEPDGRYRLGPLQGHYSKSEPEYIGVTARAARRARLLADLEARMATLDQDIARTDAAIAELVAQREALDDAVAALPAPTPLVAARRRLRDAHSRLDSATDRAGTDDERAARAAAEAANAREVARTGATARRLEPTLAALDAARNLVAEHDRAGAKLVGALGLVIERTRELDGRTEQLERAATELATRADEHDRAELHARELTVRVDTLRERLGPDADEPIRALQRIETELERLRVDERTLLDGRRELDAALGSARTAETERGADVERAKAARSDRVAALEVVRNREIRDAVFGTDTADAELPAASELAAQIVAAVSETADDEALERARAAVLRGYRQLLDELRHGYDPSLTEPDGVCLVDVRTDQGSIALLQLAALVHEQLERQRDLLSDRDRDIFERHLLTRVSESLRELLNQAGEFVTEINDCLNDTPTASGMRIELRWQVAIDDRAVRDAITLLRRSPELLGPDEREQLRVFFMGAIHAARAADSGLGYEQVLQQVLDYRGWHVFTPYLRTASERHQQLTRAVFRTLSGGEQAVALHLPLFAAAAAHYRAAKSNAPRLVALDEAFAGIDERMRGELMGLLVKFDLDVIMTGHELWGAYEEVPAVAVYDLLRRPPAEGVSALALRWDGARLVDG